MTIEEAFLTVNEFSRPGRKRADTLAIVVHWFSNPGQTAKDCLQFFENRKYGKSWYGSAQYIIGLDGEILQTMPTNEIAYHCGSSQIDPASGKIYTDLARDLFGQLCINPKLSPNQATIGIECAHIDWNGTMTDKTLLSLKELIRSLCAQYGLWPREHIILHKDVVGWKDCHKYFVDHPEAWELFKESV